MELNTYVNEETYNELFTKTLNQVRSYFFISYDNVYNFTF